MPIFICGILIFNLFLLTGCEACKNTNNNYEFFDSKGKPHITEKKHVYVLMKNSYSWKNPRDGATYLVIPNFYYLRKSHDIDISLYVKKGEK